MEIKRISTNEVEITIGDKSYRVYETGEGSTIQVSVVGMANLLSLVPSSITSVYMTNETMKV